MVISFFSRKGGTGKSTLATCSAVALSKRKNCTVCIIDADPMGSVERWSKLRPDRNIKIFREFEDLRGPINKLKKEYDFILVDLPGHDSIEMRTALLASDRAIHAVKASYVDAGTIEYVADVVKEAKKRNKKLKVKSALTMISDINKTKDVNAIKKSLTLSKMPPIKGSLKERGCYLDVFKSGLAIHEMDDPKAKREISNLVKEITK